MAGADSTAAGPGPAVPPARFLALLALAAVVGLIVSLASWCFLQFVHYLPQWVYDDLPSALGHEGDTPLWLYLPGCALAGLAVAFAVVRLPGRGGHVPAEGLNPSPTEPIALPGVLLAATATLGLGLVLGPEAPLIAVGGALAILAIRIARSDARDEVVALMAASGAFAAVSFIFESPVIAAVLLIEATGLGGPRLPLVLVPGLLAAGIGSLVSIGMGSFTGLDSSDYALGALPLPTFDRPDFVDFVWTIPFAFAIAIGAFLITRVARDLHRLTLSREFVLLPLAGLAVAGSAIAFDLITDHSVDDVLFSGQEALPGLVENADGWTVGALLMLIVCKGVAWTISLAAFRGGPVFPALLLGAAAGLAASHLAGFHETAAVAAGMGAAVVAVLRLPLSAVVLATLLTAQSGAGSMPLVIVAVVTAYVTTQLLARRAEAAGADLPAPAGAEASVS